MDVLYVIERGTSAFEAARTAVDIVCAGDSLTGWNNYGSIQYWPYPTYPQFLQESFAPLRVANGGIVGEISDNGPRLAEMTGADPEIVQLFALLHDSKRVNECTDPDHGRRAAEFAKELRGRVFDLRDREFGLLQLACAGHTDEQTHPDITVQTCWDADRLDLGRVGIMPEPSRLCTAAAKQPEMLKWADGRACFGVVPKLVMDDWRIDVKPRC